MFTSRNQTIKTKEDMQVALVCLLIVFFASVKSYVIIKQQLMHNPVSNTIAANSTDNILFWDYPLKTNSDIGYINH